MTRRATALGLSALLHVGALLLAVGQLPACGGSGAPPESDARQLRSRELPPLTVTLIPEGGFAPAGASAPEPPCPSSYVGIGIMSGRDGAVIMVGDNTPAARAGLQVGDVIVNHEQIGPDRYSAGTPLFLRIARAGVSKTVVVVVGAVCYD